MTNIDYDYLPDHDPDEALGIPSEMTQRTMLAEAVILASSIDRELRGQVPGMLADYVRHALRESSAAAALLVTMHPKDERELFELQKRAAGYASVMAWIRTSLLVGRDAQEQLNENDRKQESEDGEAAND